MTAFTQADRFSRRGRLLLLLSFSLLFWSSTAFAQRLRIVVGDADFRPFPIAAPTLVMHGDSSMPAQELARRATETLRAAVIMARSLELVPPNTYLSGVSEGGVRYQDWVNVGATGLISGSVEKLGSDARVELAFLDVVGQRPLVRRQYDVRAAKIATPIHHFIDDIIELGRGQKGVFSSRLAYVRRTNSRGKAIFVADIDGQNERRVTDKATLSLLPEWDHHGKSLLFTSYLRSNPDLYRLDLETTKLEWLSNKRGLNTGASVSPDGTRIALTLSIDGNTEIYVMNRDGGNLTRLTDSWGQDVSPTWSPDGLQIAFVSSRAGHPHIYVMGSDGSQQRRLTFRGDYNQEPDWSPTSGGQIAFTARDERLSYDIFMVHPQTGEITRLTQDQGNNESPSHSPDGQHVAFTSTRPPSYGKKVYVMDVDGRNQRRLSKQTGEHETPSWGPRLGYPGIVFKELPVP